MALKTNYLPRVENLLEHAVDFHRLLSALPIGVLIVDGQRRVVYMNRALEALCGFTHDEAQGVPCRHVMRSRICLQGCPAADAEGCRESISLESDVINRDRSLIPVRITMAPLCDLKNKRAGFIETYEDARPLKLIDEIQSHAYSFGPLVGKSPKMEKLFKILPVIAQSDSYALITGETGTGKDLVAEAIHQASGRNKGPFVKINCGALPENLLESELFGHEKGAFTGAVNSKPGRFHLAHNGTLYLTEIGDLPLNLQVKLLTFLDDRIVYPLGGTRGYEADVRIIAATHRNLDNMVDEGRFREDLYYRLNVLSVHIPPLRERNGDVRLLADHFLNDYAGKFGRNIKGFTKRALNCLLEYPYPGNVRELRNIVEYAVNICPGGAIDVRHLPSYLTEDGLDSKSLLAAEQKAVAEKALSAAAEPAGRSADWNSLEKQMIVNALISSGGRKHRAAMLLGWARTTLWRKMKQHGIDA